jgi:Zn-dependent protease
MRLLAFLIFLLTGFAVYEALHQAIPGAEGFPLRFGAVVALSIVAVFFHELGHALVARFVGARVKRFVAVPLSYDLETRKLRWVWHVRGGEVGGYVSFTLDAIGARRKHIAIAAAGPGASLLLGAAAWGGAGLTDVLLARAMLEALALLSLGAGLANLVPFEGSDGAAILRRLRATRR